MEWAGVTKSMPDTMLIIRLMCIAVFLMLLYIWYDE